MVINILSAHKVMKNICENAYFQASLPKFRVSVFGGVETWFSTSIRDNSDKCNVYITSVNTQWSQGLWQGKIKQSITDLTLT